MLAIMSVAYFREEQPYRVDFTNVIAHIAQYSILITFYCALSIVGSNSLVTFGLQGSNFGWFLILINLVIFILAFQYAWRCLKKQRLQAAEKELKALRSEWAIGFSRTKFKTTFENIWREYVPLSHALLFYYTTVEHAKSCRRSGIPVHALFDGVPLSLRAPHDTTSADVKVFSTLSKTPKSKEEPSTSSSSLISPSSGSIFPNEEVLVLSLPIQFLYPLLGYEEDPQLCMIPSQILNASCPTSFSAVIDPKPWISGLTLLSPHCILRSYQIKLSSPELNSPIRTSSLTENGSKTIVKQVIDITSIDDYVKRMKQIRSDAEESKLIPLYHYTSPGIAPLILKGGLRMSTQGQGDGGVYVSTQGPASYGLGSNDYEFNIIKDCFGVERVNEYMGKGMLDVIIVYGCEPKVFEQTPGGRANAKMVSKSTFTSFSLPHPDGNYFLRPDRILGAFRVYPKVPLLINDTTISDLELEMKLDIDSVVLLRVTQEIQQSNLTRIGSEITVYRPTQGPSSSNPSSGGSPLSLTKWDANNRNKGASSESNEDIQVDISPENMENMVHIKFASQEVEMV
jgi:hypothetical protein